MAHQIGMGAQSKYDGDAQQLLIRGESDKGHGDHGDAKKSPEDDNERIISSREETQGAEECRSTGKGSAKTGISSCALSGAVLSQGV